MYKVGDKVRVRREKDLRCEYNVNDLSVIEKGDRFISNMFKFCGKQFTISHCKSRSYDELGALYEFGLMEDKGRYVWNEYMLENDNL